MDGAIVRLGGSASRWLCLLGVGCLLLLPGACGIGGGGGTSAPLVGGVLRPSKLVYDETSTAVAMLPGSGLVATPPSVDLRLDGVIPPVKNQVWNSCVAWSLGYYVMSAVEARRMRDTGLFLDMEDPENWFSPAFLYSQRDTLADRQRALEQRAAAGDPLTGGICFERDGELGCMRPERALAALMEHGCCPWTWLCSDGEESEFRPCGEDLAGIVAARGSRSPWRFALEGSGRFRPRCYVRFGALDDLTQGTVRSMQEWLHQQGTPIAIIVNMTSGWVGYRGENETEIVTTDSCGAQRIERRAVCLDAGGTDIGSQHMMTVIGYDRSFPGAEQYPNEVEGCEGSFLVINQWGEKWGERGLMWIPCGELARIWVGGYGILPGTELVVRPDAATSLSELVCVRDDEGRYRRVSDDGNDVPARLLTACEILALHETRSGPTAPDACQSHLSSEEVAAFEAECAQDADFPPLHAHLTACRLETPVPYDPVGIDHGPAEVGGCDQSPGTIFDPADWYYVDVPEDLALPVALELRLRPAEAGATLPEDLRILVTDATYAEMDLQSFGSGVRIVEVKQAGRYFVKVSVEDEQPCDAPRTGFRYVLNVQLDVPAPPPVVPPCESVDPAPFSLAPTGLEGAHQVFRLSSIEAGQDVQVVLTVPRLEGDAPRVEVALVAFQDFSFYGGPEWTASSIGDCTFTGRLRPPESWFRRAAARTIDAQGGRVVLDLPGGLGRGVYLGGRNKRSIRFEGFPDYTVPESSRLTVFVGVRNLAPDAVDGALFAEVCGAPSEGTLRTLTYHASLAGGPITLPLRPAWEWDVYARREVELHLPASCGAPDIVLVDDDGRELTDDPGFTIQDVCNRSGVVTKRVSVPASYTDNVWFRVVESGTPGASPERFSLQLLRKASLGAWPLVQHVDAPRDGDDTPGRARVVPLSQALATPIEGSVAYDDWLDFVRLVNDTSSTQRVTLRLSRAPGLCDENPIVFASHWPVGASRDPSVSFPSEFFCHPCRVAIDRTGGSAYDEVEFVLAPGAAQMVQLQFWEIALQHFYRDVAAAYRLDVSASPP